jgi:hypothetical protein
MRRIAVARASRTLTVEHVGCHRRTPARPGRRPGTAPRGRRPPPGGPGPRPGPPRGRRPRGAVPPTEPSPRRGPESPARRWALTLRRSLRRRWLLAALFGVFCGWLVGSAVWTFYPAQHAAEVWLKFSRAPRGAFGEGELDDGAPRSQAVLLKSPLLLEAALRQPELDELLERRPRPRWSGRRRTRSATICRQSGRRWS